VPLDIILSLLLSNFVKSITPAYLIPKNCALERTLATLGYYLQLSFENSAWEKKNLFIFVKYVKAVEGRMGGICVVRFFAGVCN